MSYNSIQVIGNVGSDPDLRYLSDGTPVANFSIAVNYRRSGENSQDETEWFRVSCWRNLAEQITSYVQKGRKLFVEGRFRSRTYNDSQGQQRTSNEIVASRVVFVGGQPSDNMQSQGDAQTLNDPTKNDAQSNTEEVSEELPW